MMPGFLLTAPSAVGSIRDPSERNKYPLSLFRPASSCRRIDLFRFPYSFLPLSLPSISLTIPHMPGATVQQRRAFIRRLKNVVNNAPGYDGRLFFIVDDFERRFHYALHEIAHSRHYRPFPD